MEIYFALPVAILRIAFITENEKKVYRFDLVAFHISIVHYVSLERKLSIVDQRTITTTASSLGVYICLSVIFWVNFKNKPLFLTTRVPPLSDTRSQKKLLMLF